MTLQCKNSIHKHYDVTAGEPDVTCLVLNVQLTIWKNFSETINTPNSIINCHNYY